jgi:hypothetical protein
MSEVSAALVAVLAVLVVAGAAAVLREAGVWRDRGRLAALRQGIGRLRRRQ